MNSPDNDDGEIVSNFYETLVREEIARQRLADTFGQSTATDILCTALNRLPAKYVRHPINLLFYSGYADRDKMTLEARDAVDYAVEQVKKRG